LKFTTTTDFFLYFNITPGSCGLPSSLTMLGALNLGGGNCVALGRHSVAALLSSAAGLNYAYPTGSNDFTSLYNLIRTAFLTCNCTSLLNQLAYANNLEGPWCGPGTGTFTPRLNSGVDARILEDRVMMTAYPNPFNTRTTVEFSLNDQSSKATVEIYSLEGTLVATLFNDVANMGQVYQLEFDGSAYNSGIYIYKMTVGTQTYFDKLILMK